MLKVYNAGGYLEPEADQPQDDFSADLKPLVRSHQALKLFGQGHLLWTEDTDYTVYSRSTQSQTVKEMQHRK